MIFLTGFMGTGKTTIGGELAEISSLPFIDMDDVIVEKTGATIPEIFRYAGEKAFRMIEREVLFEVAGKGRGIVATGGGAPVNPLNRSVMKATGAIINLTAPLETLRWAGTATGPTGTKGSKSFSSRARQLIRMPTS
jgi:shikimate kinase